MICKSCQECIDFMGDTIYPYFGLAPHKHDLVMGNEGKMVLTTEIDDRSTWPTNFVEESDTEQGTWYCPDDDCKFSRRYYRKEE